MMLQSDFLFFTLLYPVTGVVPMSSEDTSILGPDMSVNIERLLEKIPERKRDAERKQVQVRQKLVPNIFIFTLRSSPNTLVHVNRWSL